MSHFAASIDLTLLHEMPLDRSPVSGLTAFSAMVRNLHGRITLSLMRLMCLVRRCLDNLEKVQLSSPTLIPPLNCS